MRRAMSGAGKAKAVSVASYADVLNDLDVLVERAIRIEASVQCGIHSESSLLAIYLRFPRLGALPFARFFGVGSSS